MNDQTLFFSVERDENGKAIKFYNRSKYIIIIESVPVYPKRKRHDIMVIYPENCRVILDEIDFEKVAIRFKKI